MSDDALIDDGMSPTNSDPDHSEPPMTTLPNDVQATHPVEIQVMTTPPNETQQALPSTNTKLTDSHVEFANTGVGHTNNFNNNVTTVELPWPSCVLAHQRKLLPTLNREDSVCPDCELVIGADQLLKVVLLRLRLTAS
jgi:predicted component of type VI protein secretion system